MLSNKLLSDDTLYHYCPLAALFAIVRSGTFHLTNAYFTNDSQEVEYFYDACRKACDRATAATKGAGDYLGRLRAWIVARIDHVYCGCFSREPDDLSQWRGYADDARGVAIGIDWKRVDEANADVFHREWIEVIYDEDEVRRTADDLLNQLCENSDAASEEFKISRIARKIRELAPSFKNSAFASEREVRLIVQNTSWANVDSFLSFAESVTKRYKLEFRQRANSLVPFIQISLPVGAIREVRIGPRFGDEMAVSALQLFLERHGMETTNRIHRSTASYAPRP